MNRRKFISLTALFCAPAVIKAENLMKVASPRGYTHDGFLYIQQKPETVIWSELNDLSSFSVTPLNEKIGLTPEDLGRSMQAHLERCTRELLRDMQKMKLRGIA